MFAGRVEFGPASLPLTARLVAVFGGRTGDLDGDVRADLLRAANRWSIGSSTFCCSSPATPTTITCAS